MKYLMTTLFLLTIGCTSPSDPTDNPKCKEAIQEARDSTEKMIKEQQEALVTYGTKVVIVNSFYGGLTGAVIDTYGGLTGAVIDTYARKYTDQNLVYIVKLDSPIKGSEGEIVRSLGLYPNQLKVLK